MHGSEYLSINTETFASPTIKLRCILLNTGYNRGFLYENVKKNQIKLRLAI